MKNIFDFFATGFAISLLPAHILKGHKNTGAGFLGTLLAVPLAVFFMPYFWIWQTIFVLLFILFAVWITSKTSFEGHDSPKIVIDEIAGYFAAVAFLPRTVEIIIAAFILFRIFDWLKPFFIKRLDNIKSAWGVVLDDVASGFLANIILQIIFLIL
ncbi:MAG: phosphatidylglycerophosphatase A [Elusimicrobiota bacterium]|jgi:phosphatidylglycerophosphatase A|nr:phosphatidylglycerophosphatase A [Elusimicrobiota bacterium]